MPKGGEKRCKKQELSQSHPPFRGMQAGRKAVNSSSLRANVIRGISHHLIQPFSIIQRGKLCLLFLISNTWIGEIFSV
jgi:hypothetical protein